MKVTHTHGTGAFYRDRLQKGALWAQGRPGFWPGPSGRDRWAIPRMAHGGREPTNRGSSPHTPLQHFTVLLLFFFFLDSGNPGKIWIRKREFSKITNRPTKNSENHRTQYTSQVRNTGFGVRRPGFESPLAVWAWPFLYLSVPQFPHLYNAG